MSPYFCLGHRDIVALTLLFKYYLFTSRNYINYVLHSFDNMNIENKIHRGMKIMMKANKVVNYFLMQVIFSKFMGKSSGS